MHQDLKGEALLDLKGEASSKAVDLKGEASLKAVDL